MINACANYKVNKPKSEIERTYYSSKGFALIYEDSFFDEGVIGKKVQNDKIVVMHDTLRRNTSIKIVNPDNSKDIDVKIYKKTFYPKIFKVVISKKVADILELDQENPYVEILELKINKTFVAKEAKIFEEEKKIAKTVQTDIIKMDDLSKSLAKPNSQKKTYKKDKFTLVISDFYYLNSANNLKKELIKKTQINNFFVIKINNKKYRLSAGPFKNFKALKSTYISLNNLGFDDLNIYKE